MELPLWYTFYILDFHFIKVRFVTVRFQAERQRDREELSHLREQNKKLQEKIVRIVC